ncbi:DUF2577 domain-containing protein [Bacillota bacterium LX-D]|nr:DUF2577 domain-containing protein [Bacillota bacterium LX-D]
MTMSKLHNTIAQIAYETIKSKDPCSIMFGTVISISPLKINIEQKLTLDESFLILTNNVKDYDVEMVVDHETEYTSGGSGDSSFSSHNHGYKGTKTFRIKQGLKVGEKVILVRVQGGQKFIVLDRI